tara:strand:+ start:4834 stop:5019 length:186 start_codon:yes stop_codon:yes gene_type:complete
MFGVNEIDREELRNSILQAKDNCEDTVCMRDLIDFLQEQIDFLEDECYEREKDIEFFNQED